MNFCAYSVSLRSKSRFTSPRFTSSRETIARCAPTLASWVRSVARAASRSASAWRTFSWNDSGSICAISWPCLTAELKSTNSSLICPETCEPTWTDVTGVSDPVAETTAVSGPRSTFASR